MGSSRTVDFDRVTEARVTPACYPGPSKRAVDVNAIADTRSSHGRIMNFPDNAENVSINPTLTTYPALSCTVNRC